MPNVDIHPRRNICSGRKSKNGKEKRLERSHSDIFIKEEKPYRSKHTRKKHTRRKIPIQQQFLLPSGKLIEKIVLRIKELFETYNIVQFLASKEQLEEWKEELFTLINLTREKYGVKGLRESRTLSFVAQLHTEDRAWLGKVSHVGSDGSNLAERIRRTGYSFRKAAENIAAGQKSPIKVHISFMKSRGHARNILRSDVDEVGIHVCVGTDKRIYWAEVFARRKRTRRKHR